MKKIFSLITLVLLINNCSISKGDLVNDNKYIVTSKKGINLRTLPGKEGEILCLIPANEDVTVINKSEKNETIDGVNESWYYIEYKTYKGWVFGAYIKKTILINDSGIGSIKMGESFEKFVDYFKPDTVTKNEDGTWILFKDNSPLMKLCDANWGNDKIVVWAELYSNIFEIKDNIHIGTSIEKLLSQYPCTEVYYDEERSLAYFNITNYSKYNKASVAVNVYVNSNDENFIITDKTGKFSLEGKTSNFHKNGKIDFIFLHQK